jgi:hypothetical protein
MKILLKSNIASESLIGYRVVCLGEGLNTMQDLVLSKDNLQELHEVRVFLEKCLINNSCDQEFIDFLAKIACLKNEDLSILKEKVMRAYEGVANVNQVITQVEIQLKQATSYLGKKIFKIKEIREQKTGSNVVRDKNELTFEEKFAFEVIEGVYEQLIEANKIILSVVENAWDYLPVDVQEVFQKWTKIQGKIDYSRKLGKIFEDYKASSKKLDKAILNAIKKGKFLPKFHIFNSSEGIFNEQAQQNTQEKSSKNSSEDTIYSTRRYTLEELVEKITPDNTYEETNWGNAVGQEIW